MLKFVLFVFNKLQTFNSSGTIDAHIKKSSSSMSPFFLTTSLILPLQVLLINVTVFRKYVVILRSQSQSLTNQNTFK